VATLVDRATGYAMVVALPDGRKADAVARALIEQMGRLRTCGGPWHGTAAWRWPTTPWLPRRCRCRYSSATRTILGSHPWQRGTNEDTNRLLRQYLHKNADLGRFSQDHLNSVAAKLNHRPRRVLGWITPAEAFDNVQQTGMLAPA
jgi:transposase, IS30 family